MYIYTLAYIYLYILVYLVPYVHFRPTSIPYVYLVLYTYTLVPYEHLTGTSSLILG